ncbi:MAG: TIGR02281 family clan AA aspartic protease [Geminicoccaceae bacterium]
MIYLAIAAAAGGLVLLLSRLFPGTLDGGNDPVRLVYYVIWIAVVGATLFGIFRQNWKDSVKHAVIWLLLLLVLVAGYTLRHDFGRAGRSILAGLVPGMVVESGDGEAVLARGEDGHFHASVIVNGTTLRMLVDTGASMVALSAQDARAIGLDPGTLDYSGQVRTANGRAEVAPIRLDEVTIGPITYRDIRAVVLGDGRMQGSLLGMTFLSRLASYRFEGDLLILQR